MKNIGILWLFFLGILFVFPLGSRAAVVPAVQINISSKDKTTTIIPFGNVYRGSGSIFAADLGTDDVQEIVTTQPTLHISKP